MTELTPNFLKAEARSLEPPETIACDVCQHAGTDREHDCRKCDDEARDMALEAKMDAEREE